MGDRRAAEEALQCPGQSPARADNGYRTMFVGELDCGNVPIQQPVDDMVTALAELIERVEIERHDDLVWGGPHAGIEIARAALQTHRTGRS